MSGDFDGVFDEAMYKFCYRWQKEIVEGVTGEVREEVGVRMKEFRGYMEWEGKMCSEYFKRRTWRNKNRTLMKSFVNTRFQTLVK